MRFVFLVLLMGVTACHSPSMHFRDIPAQRVTVDRSTFDVRVRGNLAEAVRVNSQYAPRLGPLAPRAARAMREVSGCDVFSVSGDQAVILGQLDCGKGGPVYVPGPPIELYCDSVLGSGLEHHDTLYLDLDCDVH